MSLNGFLSTHSGKATVAVALATLLIAWPPAVSWLTAAALIWWAARHLRLAFRASEREQRQSILEEIAANRAVLVPEEEREEVAA
jgi:hypothetical protein